MNQPWIYMCSPSWTPLPPPAPSHPSGSSQCTSPKHLSHASNLNWRSVSHLIMYMFRCCFLRSSHPRLLPQSSESVQHFTIIPCSFCDISVWSILRVNLLLDWCHSLFVLLRQSHDFQQTKVSLWVWFMLNLSSLLLTVGWTPALLCITALLLNIASDR